MYNYTQVSGILSQQKSETKKQPTCSPMALGLGVLSTTESWSEGKTELGN